ncbi:MAG: hypothetical protein SVT52_00700, partial [Planctomycetota bacterium]|nr:hypothetical protein [Planctomycetota bacterium]
MTTTTKNSKLTTGQLNAPVARSVGAVHVTLGLLGVAVAVMLAFLVKPVESLAGYFGPAQLPYPALPVILGVLSAVMVVAGVQLLRKHSGALSVLLLINLLDLAGAIAIALAAAVWKESPWSEAVQTLPRIVIRAILAAACVRVPADRSRLRYASLVMVSIVAAVALTVVVNIIAQADYWRRDVQTLGRFGLSDRTKTIIRSLETPVRLTCVYTSVQQDKSPADYRPRVMELLQEMQEQNDLLEVFSVTTDAEKARLVGRLRRQLGSRAEPQIECLKDFQASSDKLIRKLRRHQQRWMQVDENAYPNIWSLPAEFARHLETRAAEVEKTAAKVRDALSGTGLPDYAKVVKELTGTLESTQTTLREISSLLK